MKLIKYILMLCIPATSFSQMLDKPSKSIASDSLLQIRIDKFNKKTKSENILIINDDLGNTFLLNEEGAVYTFKSNSKEKYRKKNKLKLYYKKLTNNFSWLDYDNPICSEFTRICIFLTVGKYSSANKDFILNSFFIPIDYRINPAINQITELYFSLK